MKISYESLDKLLTAAASQLDDAGRLIRDLDLVPDSTNLSEISYLPKVAFPDEDRVALYID